MANGDGGCLCGDSGEKIVLACSGAADLGQLTDCVAREFKKTGERQMKCLAMVGIGTDDIISDFSKYDILVLDGCSVDCGKKMLERAALENFKQIRMTDLGYTKGKTPVTDELVKEVYQKVEVAD